MADYRERLIEAHQRSLKQGLDCLGLSYLGFILTAAPTSFPEPYRDGIAAVSEMLAGSLPVEDRRHSCTAVHLSVLAQAYLDLMQYPPTITIGNVVVRGKTRYQVTRQGLRDLIRRGRAGHGIAHIHVWLTFPDMTIADFTLPASMAYHGESPHSVGHAARHVVIGKPEELAPELEYRPMLAGEEFLFHINAHPPAEPLVKIAQAQWIAELQTTAEAPPQA